MVMIFDSPELEPRGCLRPCVALPRIQLRQSVTGEQRFVDEFGRNFDEARGF